MRLGKGKPGATLMQYFPGMHAVHDDWAPGKYVPEIKYNLLHWYQVNNEGGEGEA